jgi:hypothetical protein
LEAGILWRRNPIALIADMQYEIVPAKAIATFALSAGRLMVTIFD